MESPRLQVSYQNDRESKAGQTELKIKVMKSMIVFKNNEVSVNGQEVALPFATNDFYIKKSTEFFFSIQGLNNLMKILRFK
jgi:hypothetical protein